MLYSCWCWWPRGVLGVDPQHARAPSRDQLSASLCTFHVQFLHYILLCISTYTSYNVVQEGNALYRVPNGLIRTPASATQGFAAYEKERALSMPRNRLATAGNTHHVGYESLICLLRVNCCTYVSYFEAFPLRSINFCFFRP